MTTIGRPDEADARARDAADPLTVMRDRFVIPSAKDGTPEDIREYPVWLTPAN